jgi:hypothetical protein
MVADARRILKRVRRPAAVSNPLDSFARVDVDNFKQNRER